MTRNTQSRPGCHAGQPGLRALAGMGLLVLWAWPILILNGSAQDRLKTMPGYERYQKMREAMRDAIKPGSLRVTWIDEGKALEFKKEDQRYRYDIATRTLAEAPASPAPPKPAPAQEEAKRIPRPPQPDRGRQYIFAVSPDEKWKASYRDRNLWLSDLDGSNTVAVTSDGNDANRVKSGTANWVYGEELYQTTAIWWAPHSRKVAFYRFDESMVKDYYLTLDETKLQNQLDVEPYMKVGTTNPTVDILIYDLESKQTVILDTRDGQPMDNQVVGHYLYGVAWTKDGQELLFHRTNRRQNIMELCAANPESGRCRVIVRETWPDSWTENLPTLRFLEDGRRFLWASERTGFRNYYLYDLHGALLATLTSHPFEVDGIAHVDESAGLLYYMARSGNNPMKLQLHRVTLDGHGDQRLTDPAYHHSVDIAPNGAHFIDIAETHDVPPTTTLRDAQGGLVEELAATDLTRFHELGLRTAELLEFKAADGHTDLYGLLQFPSDFKWYKKYPLLVSVYAGPATTGARETFVRPNPLTEFGFLMASFDSRSASGRGKRFLDAIYLKLGQVEVDDQAAGVRALGDRRYVDAQRVGMFGTSYGGTVSILSLLRYPDVFHAACGNAALTDFRNYDTIYTERYMWIPEENQAGYDAGTAMNYVTNLQGRLMIYYGTADNNVHAVNALQLIQALQRAGKSFEVQVGPDQGHGSVHRDRMMEFFIENLILHRPPRETKLAPPPVMKAIRPPGR